MREEAEEENELMMYKSEMENRKRLDEAESGLRALKAMISGIQVMTPMEDRSNIYSYMDIYVLFGNSYQGNLPSSCNPIEDLKSISPTYNNYGSYSLPYETFCVFFPNSFPIKDMFLY